MPKYLVKVYGSTGERIDFISNDIEDSPFGDLEHEEHLYFNFKDHQDLFELLAATGGYASWFTMSLYMMWDKWVNFTVHKVRNEAPEYVGMARDEAHDKAIGNDLSFRVVLEDGVLMIEDFNLKPNRVSVYLDQNVVYKAEYF